MSQLGAHWFSHTCWASSNYSARTYASRLVAVELEDVDIGGAWNMEEIMCGHETWREDEEWERMCCVKLRGTLCICFYTWCTQKTKTLCKPTLDIAHATSSKIFHCSLIMVKRCCIHKATANQQKLSVGGESNLAGWYEPISEAFIMLYLQSVSPLFLLGFFCSLCCSECLFARIRGIWRFVSEQIKAEKCFRVELISVLLNMSMRRVFLFVGWG